MLRLPAFLFIFLGSTILMAETRDELRKALTFYASFDEEVRGDFGGGGLIAAAREGDPAKPSEFVFKKGFDSKVFRIAKDKGVRGGALEATDVLPNRGRIYFPAQGNLAYRRGGWSGAASYWLNLDPNTQLKTPFCDPIQITQNGANNGGIWTDFPDSNPRDFRLGAFPAAKEGEKPISESDPQAPLIWVKQVDFKQGRWRHIVMNWRNFDSGKPDAETELFIDGKSQGTLRGRELAMNWNVEKTGIYVAVNYVGLLDELALFDRPLTAAEIALLGEHPEVLAQPK